MAGQTKNKHPGPCAKRLAKKGAENAFGLLSDSSRGDGCPSGTQKWEWRLQTTLPPQRRSPPIPADKPANDHADMCTTLEHEVAATAAATGKRLGLTAPVLYVYNRHTKSIEVEIVPTYLLVAMQDMYRTRVWSPSSRLRPSGTL